MANQQCPEPVEGWLTTLQAAFLTRFFATDTGQLFFLTGGTALAAYHLHHRLSVDLDLFTLDDLALRETDVLIPQLAADLGCRIGRARRTEHFRQFLLEPEAGESLQIDLVRDFGPQYGEHIKMGDIVVDSMENIGANKLTAILGRTEPKDFVDLYFILHAGYDFDDLLAKAQEKDLGLQPFFMAGTLLQVRNLRHLPATTPPLTLPELQGFIIPLADWLLDRLRPPGN
ncbi:MAG: nucleotidyl transferase AbiEii/AbiGii toxin family protein [Chloroflexi bacterium]|nr:nucleotidyl transferase AbiEii/AbiGii toxin family protein [Chloroflexota bacterium]